MKVLNLDGLTHYNTNLLNKVENMIDDSIKDCVNDISVNESSIMFSKKDGSSENISLTIGDADTIDGIHADELQKVMAKLDNNTNVLEYAENYPVLHYDGTFFTYRVYNGYNEPYADSAIGSGDYYYYANKLDEKWITLIAVDVRSSNMFMRTRNNGTWGLWRNISNDGNSDTLDGYHANSFAKLSGAQFTGAVTIQSGELNGAYNGLLIGDDCYIGDCNISNTIGLMGKNDNNIAYIKFGKNGQSLGFNGSNLVYNGSVVVTENIGNAKSASDSDKLDGYHASSFCQTGFAQSTDMNAMTTSGTYRVNSGNTNSPSGTDWGQILVVHGGGDTIAQLMFDYNLGRCWLRTGNPTECGGNGSWTAWRQLYTTQNITYGTSALTPGSSSLSTGSFYYQYE